MTTPEVQRPTSTEAEEQAVTHATAAATEHDPATRAHHAQLAQVWATIALSRATTEESVHLADALGDLTSVIDSLPSRSRL